MISVHKGVAHPWQCDILGHMTTRFYIAMFDDASYHFLHHLFGWNGARNETATLGWADVRHTINYKDEVKAGELLEVRAELVKVGGKSMTASYEMINLGSGKVAATLEGIMVLFDLEKRSAVTIPDDLRAVAIKHIRADFV
ncbi:MAG: acyl-CoA thioesterase [Woeseiaceae bacterium]